VEFGALPEQVRTAVGKAYGGASDTSPVPECVESASSRVNMAIPQSSCRGGHPVSGFVPPALTYRPRSDVDAMPSSALKRPETSVTRHRVRQIEALAKIVFQQDQRRLHNSLRTTMSHGNYVVRRPLASAK
jgi:hypothetical protein